MPGRYQIAVDIGGTFTDGVLVDTHVGAAGEKIAVSKSLTTYDDPGRGIMNAIGILLDRVRTLNSEFDLGEVGRVVHGTTLVTNTLIARQGARTALIVTSGMADCLDIRREIRYATYDLFLELPEPLVPAKDRFELSGRLGPDGTELRSLDVAALHVITAQIGEADYDAVSVCLMHACTNDRHEREVERFLLDHLPNCAVSISSDVASEIGEYERMSTVAANAYVLPIVDRYLGLLQDKFKAAGLSVSLDVMMSNGAFSTAEIARRYPIKLLESGPAGGVLSAVNCAATEGIDDILAFDMGGTTAKACIAMDRSPSVTHSFEFGRVKRFRRGSGLPAITPSIDLIEIGAGGGSIASVDSLGRLKVGPESAGSEPGPACYDLGGTAPTVTDADVVLGYLDPSAFLGGTMTLNVARAERALSDLGKALGLSMIEAALGLHEIVNENMAAAARTHIAEKGLDARRFAMVATGGAGPVHAVDVAMRLSIGTIFCPIASGVGSCLGFMVAPTRADRSWTKVERVMDLDVVDLERRVADARLSVAEEVNASGLPDQDTVWELTAEVRYLGQGARVNVPVPLGHYDASKICSRFELEYTRLFGHPVPGGIPQVVTWRVVGRSDPEDRRFDLPEASSGAKSTEPIWHRDLFLPGQKQFASVPVYNRYALPIDAALTGPLIIQEPESTLVVGYPSEVSVTPSLSIKVSLDQRRS